MGSSNEEINRDSNDLKNDNNNSSHKLKNDNKKNSHEMKNVDCEPSPSVTSLPPPLLSSSSVPESPARPRSRSNAYRRSSISNYFFGVGEELDTSDEEREREREKEREREEGNESGILDDVILPKPSRSCLKGHILIITASVSGLHHFIRHIRER